MVHFIEILNEVQTTFVELATFFCDFIGASILLVAVTKSLIKYFRHDSRTKVLLDRGIALALDFKLAGEVLRTVTVRTWNELAILGTIIVLRAAISFLIHWEIKSEKIADDKAE
ncbi:MAG: DUF1622 domain-containing protein [Oscillospiraceae bacterium]|nr:DUF1622 domain-containing protein [Oscillospiraceae bacterium]